MGGIERALDFSVGTYDVVMDTGPSFATRREETSEFLQTFMQSAPQAVPILAPMMIKMMDFPDQDKTARLLETIMPPAAAAIMRGENPADLPPPPPPPEVLAEQAKAKALIEVAQNKAQADIAIADRKAEQTLILDKNRSDQKIQIEREQAQADMAVQREKHMASMELEREKALLKNELMEREIELKDRSERVKENEEIAREYIGALVQAWASYNLRGWKGFEIAPRCCSGVDQGQSCSSDIGCMSQGSSRCQCFLPRQAYWMHREEATVGICCRWGPLA